MEIRRATILGFTLFMAGLALCGAGMWLLLSPAQYWATTVIKVEPERRDMGSFMSGTPSDVNDPYFIQTEFEALQSWRVMNKVINALNLNVEWGEKYTGGATLTTNKSRAILKRRLRIAPVRNTRLIGISFASYDPDEASKVANAIAKAYQDYRSEKRNQETWKGIEVLQQKYQEEEQKIQIQRTNLDLLRRKLKIQNDTSPSSFQPSPTLGNISIADYGVGTNALEEQPYWVAKRQLENMLDFHKVLQAKIAAEQMGPVSNPTFRPIVEIVDAAQPTKLPAGPNRFLGAAVLAIGLSSAVVGWLLLKSVRFPVRL